MVPRFGFASLSSFRHWSTSNTGVQSRRAFAFFPPSQVLSCFLAHADCAGGTWWSPSYRPLSYISPACLARRRQVNASPLPSVLSPTFLNHASGVTVSAGFDRTTPINWPYLLRVIFPVVRFYGDIRIGTMVDGVGRVVASM